MHTHPYADRPPLQSMSTFGRGLERLGRRGKREEERVSLRVDLDPLVSGEDGAQCHPVLRQFMGVAFLTKFIEKLRGASDVREDECHRAARKVPTHRFRTLGQSDPADCGPGWGDPYHFRPPASSYPVLHLMG